MTCKKATFLQVGKKHRNWSVLCETVYSDIKLFHSAGLADYYFSEIVEFPKSVILNFFL
jgi:hypothetical protein